MIAREGTQRSRALPDPAPGASPTPRTSTDRILWGALVMRQPLPHLGARVGADTVLLARFAEPRARETRILELGTAAGGALLILLRRLSAEGRLGEGLSALGIEIDLELAALAEENARRNGLDRWARFRAGDLREIARGPAQEWDLVLTNPPYDERGRCSESPRESTARARQGASCGLADVLAAARRALRNGGRLCLVLRAGRAPELLGLLPGFGLSAKRLRFVHPRPGRPASVVLLEARRAGGIGAVVEPPLFIEDEKGAYTRELLEAYRIPGFASPEESPCP